MKSFFSREDELLHDPKRIPEAASEVYERPDRIVERPLPEKETKLPFTPDELRAALKHPDEEPQKRRPQIEVERDISHEIHAFESALKDVDVHDAPQMREERPVREERRTAGPAPSPSTVRSAGESPIKGYFDEFGRYALRDDVDIDGILETDIVHKMREFHKHLKEGKEYYVFSKDVEEAIGRRIHELKLLESEWFATQSQIDDLQRGLSAIEQEIEAHSREVKGLLKQARSKSKLETPVENGHEFRLVDGRTLHSLLDLKIALATMSDDVFRAHVRKESHDFAAWVRGSMQDADLASQIERITDKHQLAVFLSRMAG